MTERRDDITGPEAERVQDLLRRTAPEPASAEFRARLKNDFVSGRIGAGSAGRRFGVPARAAWAALPLAALLAVAVLLLNRAPGWELADISGSGGVVVNGERVSLAEAGGLDELLKPGAHVITEADARVDLLLPGRVLVEITPESEVVLPNAPGRWWGKSIRSRVDEGEMLFATGEEFPGLTFEVRTPEGQVVVTGTSVSVFRAAMGTCICVDTGTAMIGPDAEDMEPVPAGQRMVIPVDGEPFIDAIAPAHQEHIRDFMQREGARLR